MSLPITALYTGMLSALLIALSVAVVSLRVKHRVTIGTGNVPGLERAIRIHANFVEYVPLALLLLMLCEINQGAPRMLHSYGIALVIARLSHVLGLSFTSRPNPGRLIGATLTWLIILGLATINILYYLKH
ncbi:MAG TPA: MAPEG family protein [Gammaproteobacteria bacterium]|nr:MAPEG family protein [Gammaproteobacteria bacterium]